MMSINNKVSRGVTMDVIILCMMNGKILVQEELMKLK